MLNCKAINPKWIFIILMLILSIIIFNNNIVRTFCIEEYQIAECPDNLYLSSYYLTAENSENAIKAVENILIENNLDLDNYEIIVDKNIIKIIEKEKQEIEETKQTGTEIEEIEETTTIQDNNLTIENESVEFNNENNTINKSVRNIQGLYNIIEVPAKIDFLNGYAIYAEHKDYKTLLQQIKLNIMENIEINDISYDMEKCEIILEDLEGNTINEETFNNNNYDELNVRVREKKQETTETTETTTEEGGTINNQDIKEFKEIGICICILLAIIILHNFTSALFRRN